MDVQATLRLSGGGWSVYHSLKQALLHHAHDWRR